MKLLVQQNAASQLATIFVQNSSLTTGAGLTGLAYNTASLTAYYFRQGDASSTQIVLATMTLGTWATSGFIVVDATHMPGVYQIGIPNAALTALGSVVIVLQGAANMAPVVLEIQVVAYNPNDAALGISSAPLPAAPTANTIGEALFILDNLAGRINTAQAGAATTITLDAGASATDGRYVGYGIYLYGGTGGGIRGVGQERTIIAYVGATKVATVAQAWGTNPDNTSTFILYVNPWTNVGMWNGTAVATPATAGIPDVNAKNWGNVTVTGMPMPTYTQPTGFLAATFPSGTIANTTNITGGTIATVTNLTNAPTAGDFTATMKTSLGTAITNSGIKADLDNLQTSAGSGVFTVASLANAPTGGSAPTAAQNAAALLAYDMSTIVGEAAKSPINCLRKLRDWSISGNTLTVYKEDGSTAAYTQTLTSTVGANPITGITG
jgi:hypothetical protein